MNPRQRRGVLLMILAFFGAILVFISVLGYVEQVEARVRSLRETETVLQLTANINAQQPITEAQIQRVQVPRRYVSQAFIREPSELQQKVAAANLPSGAYLSQGMLVDSPYLRPDQREIAILIDAETGVAGKVKPNSKVDIYASYSEQAGNSNRACTVRVVSNARVLQVGQQVTQAGAAQGQASSRQVPITFALSGNDSLELAWYESFSKKLRLALIGDQNPAGLKLTPFCRNGG
jgi:pilus assembly protein CpaB